MGISMLNPKQQFGKTGESLAVRYLRKKGYRILLQNYRNKLGEIDIIAKEKGTLVFVEVKSRKSGQYGSPKYAVTPAKQRKISIVALSYLKEIRQSDAKARFDVVTVNAGCRDTQIDIIKNAFELAYP